ncbi:DUF4382 domain-containing protein [Chloroflexota bacterium]
MSDKFDKILNDCIDRINGGQTVEDCLADYPDHAENLQPMLESMQITKGGFVSIPIATARQRARQRMMAALRQPETKKARAVFAFPNIWKNMKVLATASAVLAIALASYFGVVLTSTQIVPAIANAEGNFALLISDEPNDIGDFDSLIMIVDKIHLRSAEDSRKLVEIDTDDVEVDLVLLQGENALQIWHGDVTEGYYTEVLLYSDSVTGVLAASGDTVEIKLPSGRLSLKAEFSVGGDEELTDFVYDITVIGTGSRKYILQPNTNESGTDKQFQKVDEKGPGAVDGHDNGQDDGQGGGGQGQGQG